MPRILIVEDNQDICNLLSRQLRHHGFDTITATGGQDGIKLAQNESPDVMLLDINMPDIDGKQVAQILKSDPATSNLPIIAITAHEVADDRDWLLEIGCADYHVKPFEMPRLISQIENILRDATSSTTDPH